MLMTSDEGDPEARTAFTVHFGDEKASGENIWGTILLEFAGLGIEKEVEKIAFVTTGDQIWF